MRGRISFSAARHEARWYEIVLQPLIYLTNAIVAAWTYPSWRTAHVHWEPDLAELHAFLRRAPKAVICYGWHEYELLTFCAFRDWPADVMPTGIAHDGFLSRLLHRSSTWFGFPVWVYRRKSPVSPKRQLIEFLTGSRQVIGLIADAGGPDHKVKPGMIEVARATNAFLVPMTVNARRVLTIRWPRRYRLPLPFSIVVAHHGKPFDGSETTVSECQAALEELERRAGASDDG